MPDLVDCLPDETCCVCGTPMDGYIHPKDACPFMAEPERPTECVHGKPIEDYCILCEDGWD